LRPSAGGNWPVWQVEHCPATGSWVWFQLAGRNETVLWQLPQVVTMLPVGMWAIDFPLAPEPWQPALVQFVAGVKAAWLGLATVHVTVDLWHDSQVAVPIAKWPADLPTAGGNPPVWQFTHPVATATLL